MSRLARAAALVLAASTAACGGGGAAEKPTARQGTPVTSEQALVLARVLESDRRHGGARFSARTSIGGRPVVANGRVDFRSGRGSAMVRPVTAGEGPPRRFYWTRQAVFAQRGPGARAYDTQAPDPDGDPVHAMIGFVNLLAAETIDNTANITDQHALFVGRGAIGGVPVDEYRYGPSGSTTLWVERRGGLLRRIRTTRVGDGLTVDLTSHERMTIRLPQGASE